ncbi:MAG: pyruvate kinase [Candidatus Azotimanducaceae bacterium]|jgi:pyruvate kinase
MRSTKIVATLGPASDPKIKALVAEGVDVFRLNFSHGAHEEHALRVRDIRNAARELGRYVAILADLQGPKIRISGFGAGKTVDLTEGDDFAIDASRGDDTGNQSVVGTSYQSLAAEVNAADILVLGDGLVELLVVSTADQRVQCKVLTGGELGAGKGINLRGGGLSAPSLTDKDVVDLNFACSLGVDYIAVSFVRSAEDLVTAKRMIAEAGASCAVVAKLERAEAVKCDEVIDEIIKASDAVMVARGDLGIEIGDAALMGMQKHIIARARELNRCVITATQMMESMIVNSQPTRAEVMDVANAVLDGTDAVMLSGETAVGRYPVETVAAMVRVIEGAESSSHVTPAASLGYDCTEIDESVALAAMTLAERLDGVRAVACLTASGNTPKLMSRTRSRLPIYALADNALTLARVALLRGVHPRLFETDQIDYDLINEAAINSLVIDGAVAAGDRVILSKGDYRNVQGGTNTLKIMEVA